LFAVILPFDSNIVVNGTTGYTATVGLKLTPCNYWDDTAPDAVRKNNDIEGRIWVLDIREP
jgi:hypothetical protein